MSLPMGRTIAYYFTPVSPWTYLGHDRFRAIARAAGATVEVLPVDYGAIFPVSGGLPLAKRAPQRQAYRLVELRRFSQHLGLPLNLQPKHFPVAPALASRMIVAVDVADGAERALDLAGALLRAVWVEERDIGDAATLRAILAEGGFAPGRLDDAGAASAEQRFQAYTQRAIDAGVFGAPSYVLDGEIFWGQDRLEFLERALRRR
jgi:2-hydroxychromene-2-carboxylate isomerase